MRNDERSDQQRILYSKYNSYLLKEKLYLNEKLIFQHYYDREYKNESRNPHFVAFFNENKNKNINLDLSQKYDVVRNELQTVNQKWELFEKKKDELTDELLARNQEIIQNIKDIKMEVYDLNRKTDIQSDHPRSGKINSEVFEKFFADKKTKNQNLINKLTEQNNNLKTQISNARKKIERRDRSNDLEFIDFHQLQIENKKYVKEVEEKNRLLLKLKITIGKISQDKNKTKDKLGKEIDNLGKLKKDIKKKIDKTARIDKMIHNQNLDEIKIDSKIRKLENKHQKFKTINVIIHYK